MPLVRFSPNFARHVAVPEATVAGDTVRAALDAYFDAHPDVRGYVLDERGAVREHVAVFVGGRPVRDRAGLGDALDERAEVDVFQALSGG